MDHTLREEDSETRSLKPRLAALQERPAKRPVVGRRRPCPQPEQDATFSELVDEDEWRWIGEDAIIGFGELKEGLPCRFYVLGIADPEPQVDETPLQPRVVDDPLVPKLGVRHELKNSIPGV